MKLNAVTVARAGLLVILAVSAWRSMNYRSELEPGPDSSIFMSIGWHLKNGRVLYKEEVNGPPVIYALDAAALTIGGDNVNSVRTMQRGFAVVAALAFFAATFLAFGRFWLAWIAGALFVIHQYRLHVVEDGNVTEEYGSVFILVGIAAAIAASKWSGRKRLVLAALSGMAFSLAILCKEPFLLVVPPWFVFLAWPRDGNWMEVRLRAFAFLGGAAVPMLAFVGYLTANGAWAAWIDTIATSFAYTAAGPPPEGYPILRLIERMNRKVEPMLLLSVAATLGVLGLFRRSAVRSRDGLPLAIAASAVMSLLATSLGGRFYGHYYLIFVPSFALLCASGIAFVMEFVKSNRQTGVALASALALVAVDINDLRTFVGNVSVPARRWQGHWLSELISKNTAPTDMIWTPWKPLLYAESRRLAPTRWQSAFDIYFTDTPGSTAEQKFETLRSDLRTNPPGAIVISPLPGSGPTRGPADDFLRRSGLTEWINANYQSIMCSNGANYDLLLLKSSVAKSGAAPGTGESVAMQLGLVALYQQADPMQAVACFRKVLATNPTHYGASYQLAKSLDAAGFTGDATSQWRIVLALSRQWKDPATEAQALARLR